MPSEGCGKSWNMYCSVTLVVLALKKKWKWDKNIYRYVKNALCLINPSCKISTHPWPHQFISFCLISLLFKKYQSVTIVLCVCMLLVFLWYTTVNCAVNLWNLFAFLHFSWNLTLNSFPSKGQCSLCHTSYMW